MYSKPVEQLIRAFTKLPGVGRRTAERFVFKLLKSGKKDVGELTLALKNLMDTVKSCDVCWTFSDQSPCHICADTKRDTSLVCVVAEPQDVEAIERSKQYTGRYHILRGLLDTDVETSLKFLKIHELVDRAKKGDAKEIILALNPTLDGETTMMHLERAIKNANPAVTVSRLARGLPMGSDLKYADEITLGSALKHRTRSG